MIDCLAAAGPCVAAPPIPSDGPIDRRHLAQMTLGDGRLEREILALFQRQAAMLLARMERATPKAVDALAHTLKGSARGIGAWPVADAAEALERASTASDRSAADRALAQLRAAVFAADAAIAEILRAQ